VKEKKKKKEKEAKFTSAERNQGKETGEKEIQ